MTVLSPRALNRATLARQLLLDRADRTVLDTVAHLCGLQAQEPQEPFVGLWSRVAAFDPADLSDLLVRRQVVRTHLMRRTVHLLTADDTLAWRSRHDSMLRQRVLGTYRRELAGVDLAELAAAGHAVMADIRAWSGLAGLPTAVQALRPQLMTFRDERGRELLDLPDAPRPDPDTPAPVRFLPAFDNALLGYDDRSRIVDDEHRNLSVAGTRVVLVDGRVAATWTVTDDVVTVTPLRTLSRRENAAVAEEAEALTAFLSPTRQETPAAATPTRRCGSRPPAPAPRRR